MCHAPRLAALSLALLTLAACDGATAPDRTTLASVAPSPAQTGVATGTSLTFTFSTAMMAGMEQYVDLHHGGVDGAVVPMDCTWSADQRTLTCTPDAPLDPGTRYTMHVGGGMRDAHGGMADLDHWAALGGGWMTGGMMGGTHAGEPMSGMGSGWRHGTNHYGMTFEFRTA